LCINITNVQGRQPAVRYQTTRASPTISFRSLPDIPTLSKNNEEEEEVNELLTVPLNELLPVPLKRSLRNKSVFRQKNLIYIYNQPFY
jgi:hypothetical protein